MYMMQEIAYSDTFLVNISVVFLARTKPASNIVKPAAIHITSAPQIKK
ncbi:hypothetical protein GNIT_0414 [Glaciecola nitratireducens FR1064]|uniref:Uncharacterized protein n=1 Tax=Glaciecola nitratireducens (strain JCM 12485 / KCTC 12276 / FR1064) TaxID=1085623 RepID=G4QJG2_GLANF|nr:hypothetical protein GNIT_0414 [Glaciecola nitratireducens FR1064]